MDVLKRNLFWVGVGALTVAAVVGYVLTGSVASANEKIRKKLDDRRQQLEQLASGGALWNEAALKAYEQYQEQVEAAYEQALEFIQKRSVDPYKLLPNVVATDCVEETVDGRKVLRPIGSIFASRYPQAVAQLAAKLEASGINAVPGALGLPALTGPVPDKETIWELQRRYWRVHDVVEALIRHKVRLDQLLWIGEESGEDGRGGMGMGPRLDESVVTLPRVPDTRFSATGTRGGGPSESSARLQQLTSGGLGVTTKMNEFFSPVANPPAQVALRVIAVLDFRELPKLLAALEGLGAGGEWSRLSLVRKVDFQHIPSTGRPVPRVRVDMRALVFERYSEFAPVVVTQ